MRQYTSLLPQLTTLTIFVSSASAIFVAPSSQCRVSCGNVLTSTQGSDITCADDAYATSTGGATFQSCLTCEINSGFVDPASNVSDLGAALYNARYAVSSCLWGNPSNASVIEGGQCLIDPACGKLQSYIEYGNFSTAGDPLAYCDALDKGWDANLASKCSLCLQNLGNADYLANFVTALDAACIQMPVLGSEISISGSLFRSTPVVITTPTPSGSASYNFNPDSGPLSLAAKIGIAIGAIVFILIVAGCIIVCRGKRRRRAHLARLARNSFVPHGMTQLKDSHSEGSSPQDGSIQHFGHIAPATLRTGNFPWQNQGYGGGTDESPVSAIGEPRTFSPYISPISPQNGHQWVSPTAMGDGKGKSVHLQVGRAEDIEMERLGDKKGWREEVPTMPIPPGNAY